MGEASESDKMQEKVESLKRGLARCQVCGEEAEIVFFGARGEGVWVGCCQTVECSRYVEYHKEGWSVEDAVRDWNRRNRGVLGLIRRIKRWFRNNLGEVAAEKRRVSKEKKGKKRENKKKMKEIFGV
ncbi:MAG: hypothetical protein J6Q22_09345 [Prevotella sp.]|nr:hypothetical protein [Prevotella sp.]